MNLWKDKARAKDRPPYGTFSETCLVVWISVQYLQPSFTKNAPQIRLVSARAADMPETCGFHQSLSFRAPMTAELWSELFGTQTRLKILIRDRSRPNRLHVVTRTKVSSALPTHAYSLSDRAPWQDSPRSELIGMSDSEEYAGKSSPLADFSWRNLSSLPA